MGTAKNIFGILVLAITGAVGWAAATHIPYTCDGSGHCEAAVPGGVAPSNVTVLAAGCPDGFYPYRGVDHLTCIPYGRPATEAVNGICWMHVPEPPAPEPPKREPEEEEPRRAIRTPAEEPLRPDAFNRPRGVDWNGTHIFVADTGNRQIKILNASGILVHSFGEAGAGPGQFDKPVSIAVHGSLVFVSDYANERIQIYNHAGDHIMSFGGSGTGPGRLNLPMGLAVNDTHVMVADSANHRIQIFDLLEEGAGAHTIGSVP